MYTYVLRKNDAQEIHEKFNITPIDSKYVPINGLIKYVSKDLSNDVLNSIEETRIRPLSYTLDTTEYKYNIVYFEGLYEILSALIKVKLNKDVYLQVEKTYFENNLSSITLTPIIDNENIYSTSTLLDFDLTELWGYGLVYPGIVPIKGIFGVKEVYGILIYDLETMVFVQRNEMLSRTRNLRNDYDYAFDKSKISDKTYGLLYELSVVWSLPYTETRDQLQFSNTDLFPNIGEWLKESIQRLLKDKAPVIKIITNETYSRNKERKDKFIYACKLCLKEMNNKYVNQDLYVDDDFVIYLPSWTPLDMDLFIKMLPMFIGQRDIERYDTNIEIKEESDFEKGERHRDVIRTEDGLYISVNNVLRRVDNEDYKISEWGKVLLKNYNMVSVSFIK